MQSFRVWIAEAVVGPLKIVFLISAENLDSMFLDKNKTLEVCVNFLNFFEKSFITWVCIVVRMKFYN